MLQLPFWGEATFPFFLARGHGCGRGSACERASRLRFLSDMACYLLWIVALAAIRSRQTVHVEVTLLGRATSPLFFWLEVMGAVAALPANAPPGFVFSVIWLAIFFGLWLWPRFEVGRWSVL